MSEDSIHDSLKRRRSVRHPKGHNVKLKIPVTGAKGSSFDGFFVHPDLVEPGAHV